MTRSVKNPLGIVTNPKYVNGDVLELDQDWCSGCDNVTFWDSETCRACGYTWGEGA